MSNPPLARHQGVSTRLGALHQIEGLFIRPHCIPIMTRILHVVAAIDVMAIATCRAQRNRPASSAPASTLYKGYCPQPHSSSLETAARITCQWRFAAPAHIMKTFKMASMEEEEGASNDNSNTMEVDRESEGSSNNQEADSSSDSSDDEAEDDKNLANLEEKVMQNPYDYTANVELINTLRRMGELEKLREVRERMHKHFPLSPELWKAWLEDEGKVATSQEERLALKDLFERAVKDYVSVELWLEYVQFSIGFMGDQNGMDSVRSVFERALTAAGLHVSKGVVLWEAYREFELCMLNMLETKAEESPEDKEKYDTQKRKLDTLFRRQLSVPLLEMERAYEEYVNWVGGGVEEGQSGVDPNVDRTYKKALAKLNKVLPYEMQLMSTPESRTTVYHEYIAHEKAEGEPTRVQCLYERALAELCLDPALWLDYIKYLDTQLKIDSVVLPVCERAVRNCPWSAPLWVYYLRVLERFSSSHEKVTDVMEQALGVGFSTAAEYRGLWMAYLDYLRRRVKWGEPQEEGQLKELRAAYNRACEHLAQCFGLQGDPTCMVLQAWARMEAIHTRDMEATRRLWNDILSQGHDKTASMWLEYISLEKCYGDTKHLRRLYQRALTATQDWPESIGDAWINFERDEGTLETYEICESKFENRMKAVLELREKQEAQQAAQQAESAAAHRRDHHEASKRKRDDVSRWAALAGQSITVKKGSVGKPASKPEESAGNGEPSPSVSDASEEPLKKKAKSDKSASGDHGVKVEHDPTKDIRTVFVSNLEYSVTEDQIKEKFAAVGTITDLRLVKDFKGRSKGYCYVEFSIPSEAAEALKKDREGLGGRPMFVSKCDPDKQKRDPGFKYSSELEKNKLFVKGLPLTTTKKELEELFRAFGKLKDVRIVTYRNGHSKGLAYVEFIDEAAAAHALIKTDGITVGDRTISVAISKPPDRKGPLGPPGPPLSSAPFVSYSLGGGVKEKGARGRGRTQMFVPRALQRASVSSVATDASTVAPSSGAPSSSSSAGSSNGHSSKPKSNNDFRQMLLGNK